MEAELRRHEAWTTREAGEVAAAELDQAGSDLPMQTAAAHSAALRGRLTRVALDLARVEENIAVYYDKLAAQRPDRAAEHREVARQARAEAETARGVARRFGG